MMDMNLIRRALRIEVEAIQMTLPPYHWALNSWDFATERPLKNRMYPTGKKPSAPAPS